MVDDLSPPLSPHAGVPPGVASLADYARLAPRHLSPDVWAHIDGPAGAGARDRAVLDRLCLLPRVLRDLRGGDTAIDLLGQRHAAPVLLAPIAYQRLAHPEGELAVARAAGALGFGFAVSTLASETIEDVAAAWRAVHAEAAPAPWFQLYLQPERARSEALVRRAEAAGCAAIMVTVDAAVKRADFALPPGIDAANLRGAPARVQSAGPGDRILFGTPLADAAPRWDDLAWLRAATRLPLIVKGVLAPDDALRAIDQGADALVVSNHGGRVVEAAPAALTMVPAVAAAVAGRVPILVDGAMRSGADVARAMALGAAAVLVGRPQMHGLAVAGAAGVAHVLHMLRGDFELTLAQLGCRSPAELGPDALVPL